MFGFSDTVCDRGVVRLGLAVLPSCARPKQRRRDSNDRASSRGEDISSEAASQARARRAIDCSGAIANSRSNPRPRRSTASSAPAKTTDGYGWRAYLTVGDEDNEEALEAVVFCLACAAGSLAGHDTWLGPVQAVTTTWLPIAIAVLSVFVAVLLPRHERDERRNDIEVEHSNRREEIALLRRQVEQQSEQAKRQEERYEDEDKAWLTVSQGSKSGGVSMDAYAFTVTNAGPAVARHVRVELRDASGRPEQSR